MKQMAIGVASNQAIRARALAIARGDHQPRASEPKIWFASMRSLAEVLSDDNRALLRVIREQKPESLGQLAEFTGRTPSNLLRMLKTMEHYGLVELQRDLRTVRPVVTASEFVIRAAWGRRLSEPDPVSADPVSARTVIACKRTRIRPSRF